MHTTDKGGVKWHVNNKFAIIWFTLYFSSNTKTFYGKWFSEIHTNDIVDATQHTHMIFFPLIDFTIH